MPVRLIASTFSFVPEAKVVIDTVLTLSGFAVGTNILAAIIYDAAKGFLKLPRTAALPSPNARRRTHP
jgi:hypothetical protein